MTSHDILTNPTHDMMHVMMDLRVVGVRWPSCLGKSGKALSTDDTLCFVSLLQEYSYMPCHNHWSTYIITPSSPSFYGLQRPSRTQSDGQFTTQLVLWPDKNAIETMLCQPYQPQRCMEWLMMLYHQSYQPQCRMEHLTVLYCRPLLGRWQE